MLGRIRPQARPKTGRVFVCLDCYYADAWRAQKRLNWLLFQPALTAGHIDEVNGVAMSGDGRYAVSASYDQMLKVWDVETGRELHTLKGHSISVYGVAMSGDGRRTVSASADQTLKVWNVNSGRELQTLAGHTGKVRGVALSGDGRRAVSASDDQTLKVWNVKQRAGAADPEGTFRRCRTPSSFVTTITCIAIISNM